MASSSNGREDGEASRKKTRLSTTRQFLFDITLHLDNFINQNLCGQIHDFYCGVARFFSSKFGLDHGHSAKMNTALEDGEAFFLLFPLIILTFFVYEKMKVVNR